MIFRDSCFLKNKCAKYKRGNCTEDFCVKLFKENAIYDKGLFSNTQRVSIPLYIDKDGTDSEQFRRLQNIELDVENFVKSGVNLYLHSCRCGNGKTSWALRIAQAYVDRVWYKCDMSCKVLFISVPKFLILLKDNISSKNEYITHIKDVVADCDLVIWDDIGTKAGTEFEIENMLNIIDNRLCNGKSNIYTSNLRSNELLDSVGPRLHSRIVNRSVDIELMGSDKRGL